jgi:hypothetical protein
VKPYPTQPNFKPYPTQPNFKPYPTQASAQYLPAIGGGVFVQPGQQPKTSSAVLSNFNDAVGHMTADVLEDYITRNPNAINEKG